MPREPEKVETEPARKLKVKKFRIAKTYNKNTTTPRIHSRVMEAKVMLR